MADDATAPAGITSATNIGNLALSTVYAFSLAGFSVATAVGGPPVAAQDSTAQRIVMSSPALSFRGRWSDPAGNLTREASLYLDSIHRALMALANR